MFLKRNDTVGITRGWYSRSLAAGDFSGFFIIHMSLGGVGHRKRTHGTAHITTHKVWVG